MIAASELATDRLLLRQWQEGDHEALSLMLADESARFLGGPMDAEQSWRLLAAMIGHWQLRGFGLYALEDRETAAFVGWTGLLHTPEKREAELAWALTPAMRGKGYAVEAAARVRRHAYADLRWSALMSLVDPENAASQKVAQRLGAMVEGQQLWRGTMVERWRHPAPESGA